MNAIGCQYIVDIERKKRLSVVVVTFFGFEGELEKFNKNNGIVWLCGYLT